MFSYLAGGSLRRWPHLSLLHSMPFIFFLFSVAKMMLNPELKALTPLLLSAVILYFSRIFNSHLIYCITFTCILTWYKYYKDKGYTMKSRSPSTLQPSCLPSLPQISHHYKFLECPSRDKLCICKQMFCK